MKNKLYIACMISIGIGVMLVGMLCIFLLGSNLRLDESGLFLVAILFFFGLGGILGSYAGRLEKKDEKETIKNLKENGDLLDKF